MNKIIKMRKTFYYLMLFFTFFLFYSCSEKFYIKKAKKYYEEKMYYKAEEHYSKALRKDPFSSEAKFGIGKSLFFQNDFRGSIHYLSDAYRLYIEYNLCDLAPEVFFLGESYLELGNYNNAILCFEALINNCDYFQSDILIDYSNFFLGQCNYAIGIEKYNNLNNDEALSFFNKAIDYFKNSTIPYQKQENLLSTIAEIYFKKNDFKTSAEKYQHLIANYPYSSFIEKYKKRAGNSLFELAKKSLRNKQITQAHQYLLEAEKYDSTIINEGVYQFISAEYLKEEGKYNQAISKFIPLLEKSNYNDTRSVALSISECYFEMGITFYNKNGIEYAFPYFNKSLLFYNKYNLYKDTKYYDLNYYIGKYMHLIKGIEQAEPYYQIIIKNPNHNKFHEICHLLAEFYEAKKDWNNTIKIYEALYDKQELDSYAFKLAELYAKINNSYFSYLYLSTLYDSPRYHYYRRKVIEDILNYSCLSENLKFYKWLTGYRRLRVQVEEAFSNDNDMYGWGGENDLCVLIYDDSYIYLCTPVIDNNNHPIWDEEYFVFDYEIGSELGIALIEEDLSAADHDILIDDKIYLKIGNMTIKDGDNSWIHLSITETNSPIVTTNTSLPEGIPIEDYIEKAAVGVAAAYVAFNYSNLDKTKLFSCLVQSGISQAVNNPFAASIVAEVTASLIENKKISVNDLGSEFAIAIIERELKNQGYDEIASVFASGSFIKCLQ